jgi:hypothetical protein
MSTTEATFPRRCPGASEFDFHREWKAVPDFQSADLARINLADVLKEFDHLAFELKLVR